MATTQPLIVILGPTASGKTEFAIKLAQLCNGEIIAADSRTVYKSMDIGTAKPSIAEQVQIPHHLINIVKPDQKFTVAEFKKLTLNVISDIQSRNKIPFLVGGSGLYIDSIIFNYEFGPPADPRLRAKLEASSLQDLQAKARHLNISSDQVNYLNKRHLSRAIENGGIIKQKLKLRANTLVIGLQLTNDELKKRITERVEKMFEAGFVAEVESLAKKYGWDNEAMTGIGYRAVRQYLEGQIDLEQAKADFVRGDILLAKKQRTWFKRNKYVHWITNFDEAHHLVDSFLNKNR